MEPSALERFRCLNPFARLWFRGLNSGFTSRGSSREARKPSRHLACRSQNKTVIDGPNSAYHILGRLAYLKWSITISIPSEQTPVMDCRAPYRSSVWLSRITMISSFLWLKRDLRLKRHPIHIVISSVNSNCPHYAIPFSHRLIYDFSHRLIIPDRSTFFRLSSWNKRARGQILPFPIPITPSKVY